MSNTFSILVVDDDEASRVMMVEALRRSGYQLRGADSAEAALALLALSAFFVGVTLWRQRRPRASPLAVASRDAGRG